MERVRPGKRGAHPAITEFNQEDFEMFFRLVRRPETSVWPQPPSQRSPQFPVASCLVKIHSSHRKTGFLRAHGPSESATSECKRGCGRTVYFKICGPQYKPLELPLNYLTSRLKKQYHKLKLTHGIFSTSTAVSNVCGLSRVVKCCR